MEPDHMDTNLPLLSLPLPKIEVSALAAVTHKPGAVRLDGYPLLVYAPVQHGPGIRTEDNGTPVADIAVRASEVSDLAVLAAQFGTSAEHVRQAISYTLAALPKT
jgi:hypothetical protein